MKGTSDGERSSDILVIDKELTLWNDNELNEIAVNWGRSNQLNQINQTGQTQGSCFIEWILSCSEWC